MPRVLTSSIFALFLLWHASSVAGEIARTSIPTDRLRPLLCERALNRRNLQGDQLAEENRFVVYGYYKSLTLIALTEHGGKLGLEEICISKAAFESLKVTWQQWRDLDYPRAFSHFRLQWPSKGEQACEKVVVKALIPCNRQPLAHTLLRVLWQIDAMPYSFSTKLQSPLPSKNRDEKISIFTSQWPDDDSPLANKPLLLYFDTCDGEEKPNYWPSCIRIGSGLQRQNLVAIASGRFQKAEPRVDESLSAGPKHLQIPSNKKRCVK